MKIECDAPSIIVWTREEALRDSISYMLGDDGFTALNLYDKSDLFRILADHPQAIVILEEGLPRIMGFELYELIKKIERLHDTKVILISTFPGKDSFADEFISKDSVQDLLMSKIRSLLPDECKVPEAERKMHEEARRFAKIIVSDIVLYNREKAETGAKDGTFHEKLKDEIQEGRAFYASRMSPEILATTDFFDEAIDNFIQANSKV